jgi:hypothetical protein
MSESALTDLTTPTAPGDAAWVTTVAGDRCYWAILPATTGKPLAASEAYRFEEYLPFAVEQLQCAFTALPDGRTLAAGLQRSIVQEQVSAVQGSQMWVLRPAELPAHVVAAGVEASAIASMNFLHGPCLPRPARRQMALLSAIVVACGVIACGAILILGGRRVAAWSRATEQLELQRIALADRAVPPVGALAALPATARLLQAHRQAQSQRGSGTSTVDALGVIDAIWRKVPTGTVVALVEISADQRRVLLRASVRDLDALRQLSEAVTDIESPIGTHWRLEPTDLQSGRSAPLSVQLSWLPVGAEVRP